MEMFYHRPCFAIGYDTPANYWKRYYNGELPHKNTFESRKLSTVPKFVQKKIEVSKNERVTEQTEDVSTFENENGGK